MAPDQTPRARSSDVERLENGYEREYIVRVSREAEDPEWDAFLRESVQGHHVQTSLWGQVKACQGWRTVRVIVTDAERIVAGAQMLFRRTRIIGHVGYVPRGPIFSHNDPNLTELVTEKLQEVARDRSIRALFVQPPTDNEALTALLQAVGFRPSPIETAPTATVLVGLEGELETILARMRKGMRNNIRRSERRGIEVREGTKDDLPTFHRLLEATSLRRGFVPFELSYFAHMWSVLSPHGLIRLFLCEYEGEPISAQLVIPFGDTVVAKQIGWSGRHAALKPNEGLDWATIKWAKSEGFRYYDLEGIEPLVAKAIVSGEQMPKSFTDTPTAYKLRLGGEVRMHAEAWCYLQNPILRVVYNRVGYRIARTEYVQKAADRFRTN